MTTRASLHSTQTSSGRIAHYVEQKQRLLLTPYVIKPDGNGYFIVNGVEYPEKEFLAQNEICLLPLARDNYDKTKAWMNNKKSY